jgi:hypothetical protein
MGDGPTMLVLWVTQTHAPACIACSPVCTQCWATLPDSGDLQHAIMRRCPASFPELMVLHVLEPVHA